MATMATTNLLKSADTFLIASFMGPAAVAKYAVPLKLTELFDIPLRSLSTTAFPQLASRHNNQDKKGFKDTFVQYISWAYMLYVPALVFCFIFAELVVVIMGGNKYIDTAPIFRMFVLYALLLPSDRLTGISLDALQMPSRNFQKVFIMAIVNIIGDVAAIYFTHNLVWVAFASVLNAATGAILGWWMLERTGVMAPGKIFSDVFAYSSNFIQQGVQRLKRK
jgi:O-antigen/teichoic acid export membrane protein